MNYLKLFSITVLLLECFVHAHSELRLKTRRTTTTGQPTTKKNVLNSMLDSIFSAFHPGNSTDKPVFDLSSNVIWQFQYKENDTSTIPSSSSHDESTSTPESYSSPQSKVDSEKGADFPSEGFFDPYADEMVKYFPPRLESNRAKYRVPWSNNKREKISTYFKNDQLNKDLATDKHDHIDHAYIVKRSVNGFTELRKSNELDQFKPIRPDLNVPVHPEMRPDIDINAVLGQLNSLILNTATTTPRPYQADNPGSNLEIIELLLPETSTIDQIENSLTTTLMSGPFSTQTTIIPIIGPLNSPNDIQNDHGHSQMVNSRSREGYNLITLNKIDAPLLSMIEQITPTSQTLDSNSTLVTFINEQGFQNSESANDSVNKTVPASIETSVTDPTIASSTKKSVFPWPIIRKKHPVTPSTTTEKNEIIQSISDKMEGSVQDTSSTNGIIPESTEQTILDKTTTKQPRLQKRPTIRLPGRPMLITLKSTIKPKLPYWLTNFLSPIMMKTTPRSSHKSTKSIFQTNTKRDEQDDLGDNFISENNLNEVSDSTRRVAFTSSQSYLAGINSGHGFTGVGNTNGQGGIMIGVNSGLGKRPSKRPYIAKQIVVSVTKPTLIPSEAQFEE